MHDGNPNGYYLLKFTGRSVQPRFIPQGHKGNLGIRMRIVLDPLLNGTIDSLGNNRSINRGSIFSRANYLVSAQPPPKIESKTSDL